MESLLVGRPAMTEGLIAGLRGGLGVAVLLALAWLLSRDRRRVNWRLVVFGMGLQVVIAVAALKLTWLRLVVDAISQCFVRTLDFSRDGAAFLFGTLITETDSFGYLFAFQVLPTIVFFAALTSVLYYLNILQAVVFAFAWVMKRTMRLSGSESLAAAANVFVGQTEAPLMVKPYIDTMTRSEIMALMTGGMATIAGAVLAAYVGMLGGAEAEARQFFATHLMVASLISAPAGLVVAKIMTPETDEPEANLFFPRDRMGSSVLDALTQGTTEGVKLAVNVGAMLLVFTALVSMVNAVLHDGVGTITGLNDWVSMASRGRYDGLSLQAVLGAGFAPIAWLIGVPAEDLLTVGQLLGEKTILNEFFAYTTFAELKQEGVLQNPKSILIATYALCGFANVASVGIQIGGISVLAPHRREMLCQLGIPSLVAGTIACLLTACLAGVLA
jgi:CNT family concentrative nucleoside transporter